MRGLLVDFGGVLTTPLGPALRAFEAAAGMPKGRLFEVLAAAYTDGDDDHPIARLETGRLDPAAFEVELAERITAAGHPVQPDGLIRRLLGDLKADEAMWGLVAQARAAGVRTGLLSNSWGTGEAMYPTDRLGEYFDHLVISGDVGLRKPDADIYLLAAQRLGLPPGACAFIDDHDGNVEAARGVGMFGVHHAGDAAATATALGPFLEVDLQVDPPADGRPSTRWG